MVYHIIHVYVCEQAFKRIISIQFPYMYEKNEGLNNVQLKKSKTYIFDTIRFNTNLIFHELSILLIISNGPERSATNFYPSFVSNRV